MNIYIYIYIYIYSRAKYTQVKELKRTHQFSVTLSFVPKLSSALNTICQGRLYPHIHLFFCIYVCVHMHIYTHSYADIVA